MNLLPKIIAFVLLFLLALSMAIAQETTEFNVDPGITPDSPFYFIDTFFEQVGDSPEKALQYKEEKLAELKVMAAEKKTDAATIALAKAQEYGAILEKEVTPAMETTVSENAAAVEAVLTQAVADLPELTTQIKEKQAQEERITLAAEISTKIKQLCETLSQLDAQQYAQNCKTDKDAPQWQQRYDKELTAEQQKHAKVFAEKMVQCMETQGKVCDCEGMGVKKWAQVCTAWQELKERCDGGEEDSCKAMVEQGSIDMFDYLPDYLYPVVQGLMKRFDQAQERQYEQFEGKEEYISEACKEAGVNLAKECAEYMKEKYREFKREDEEFEFDEEMFMEGCIKYESNELCAKKAMMMKKGQFSSDNVMFGPGPCTDKGITTLEECKKYMEENFQKTAQGAYVVPASQSTRIGEFDKDCHAVKELAEKARCFEDFYDQAREKFTQPMSPPSTALPTGYQPGMEEWERSYYERWINAETEEEQTEIKREMSEMMRNRKEQDNERYKKEYTYEYKDEGNQYPAPSTTPTGSEIPSQEPSKIKAEIEGDMAEVKVSQEGYTKDKFTMPYMTRDQLVSDVALRLGLTKEEVEKRLELVMEEAEEFSEETKEIEEETEEGEEIEDEIEDEPSSEEREEADEDIDESDSSGSGETGREEADGSMTVT